MELADLVGLHTLDAFDYSADDSVASGVRFRLDGITYMGVENADDGYRSFLNDIQVSNTPPINVFHKVPVACAMSLPAHEEILHIISVDTNNIIASIGTDRGDDYYPSCVLVFYPENLPPPPPTPERILNGGRRMRVRRA